MESRVKVIVKVTVRNQCIKGLMWYGCSIPAAELLDLSAVDVAQLAHAADECILCRAALSQMTYFETRCRLVPFLVIMLSLRVVGIL